MNLKSDNELGRFIDFLGLLNDIASQYISYNDIMDEGDNLPFIFVQFFRLNNY